MKKKLIVTALSVTVGVVLLVSTAFASMSASSGYDTYKSSIKNMVTVKSFTGNVQISLKDNGKDLATINSKVKADNSSEIKFEIKKSFGVLAESAKGWKKELNLISWNEKDPKYDIRDWD